MNSGTGPEALSVRREHAVSRGLFAVPQAAASSNAYWQSVLVAVRPRVCVLMPKIGNGPSSFTLAPRHNYRSEFTPTWHIAFSTLASLWTCVIAATFFKTPGRAGGPLMASAYSLRYAVSCRYEKFLTTSWYCRDGSRIHITCRLCV